MAKCVKILQDQDGTYKLIPDQQPDLKQCEYVLQTGGEVSNSLTDLTPAQAAEISGYVAALWAAVWVIKQLAKLIEIGPKNEPD